MLKIRLSRVGKKNKPMYRLTISEAVKDPYGKALEILGSYNPYTKELIVKEDRINYWLSQGAQMTPTTNNLLLENKLIKGEKVKASISRKKKKGGDKEEEKTPIQGEAKTEPAAEAIENKEENKETAENTEKTE